jgi:phospholipid:diacylglycerol acyltransferase
MPGISSMLPKGGEAIWGNLTWAPDDRPGQAESYGSLLKYACGNSTTHLNNMTIADSLQFLLDNSDGWYRNQLKSNYSHGVALTKSEIEVCWWFHYIIAIVC